MKKRIRTIGLILLVITLNITFYNNTNAAEKIIIYYPVFEKGKTYELTMEKTDTEVQWSSSNKKIVKILNNTGTKGRTIKVKALEKGESKIMARTGDKLSQYMVCVMPKDKIKSYTGKKNRVSLLKVKTSKYHVNIKIKISNSQKKRLDYIKDDTLQKRINGKWKKIKMPEGYGEDESMSRLAKKSTLITTVNLSSKYGRSQLTTGEYRLGVRLNKKVYYIFFKLK